MKFFSGNPVSEGIAIGRICKYEASTPKVSESFFPPAELDAHLAEYSEAKDRAQQELKVLYASMKNEKAEIFKSHMDILDDEVMDEEIVALITGKHMSPDHAVFTVYNTYIDILGRTVDPLIRERTTDLEDVRNRIIRKLHHIEEKNLSCLLEPSIILAEELFPSDTATLDRKNIIGIATEKGSATSHTAIIARSYGIPAVLGISGLMEAVEDGAHAVLDALTGTLIIEPDTASQHDYTVKRDQFTRDEEYARQFIMAKAVTKDGVKVDIGMNIGSSAMPEHSDYCEFIGLFRTEFLYMESNTMPTEEEQYTAYKSVLAAMKGRPVTIRTLDIGGDKNLNYLKLPQEDNPFLGNRALRLCFDRPELLKTQLRAALRASLQGTLWIMFPMVGSLEVWRRAKAYVEEVKMELGAQGIPYSDQIKLGIMIEIPSAALFADKLAREVDFASIGTNDLCQYMFAVDRMNPAVADYYQEFSPALFRAIYQIVSAFNNAGKPISICGELGGSPTATAVLIGLGLRKLSMSPASFGRVKRVIAGISASNAAAFAQKVLDMDTEQDVIDAAKKFIGDI